MQQGYSFNRLPPYVIYEANYTIPKRKGKLIQCSLNYSKTGWRNAALKVRKSPSRANCLCCRWALSVHQMLYHDCGDRKRTPFSPYMKQTWQCYRQGNSSHFWFLFKNVLFWCIPHFWVSWRRSSVLAELPVQWIRGHWNYYCLN